MKIVHLDELEKLTLDPAAIAMVPESVARDSCVLPVSWDGTKLHLVVPSNAGLGGDPTFERLSLILDCEYTYDFAEPADLRSIVDLFYTAIYAEIENCERFRYRCPKRFASLSGTEDPMVRFCAECQQRVYYCRTEAELEARAEKGECVAFMHVDHPQEFMGLPM
jgi:hypothetical protein